MTVDFPIKITVVFLILVLLANIGESGRCIQWVRGYSISCFRYGVCSFFILVMKNLNPKRCVSVHFLVDSVTLSG